MFSLNLSHKLQQLLDGPVKAFEVAFRCYVADTLLTNYPTETKLKTELQNRVDETNGKEFLLAGKLSSAKSLLNNSEWRKFWDNITFIRECYVQKKHFESHDVTDLGDTILISYLFQRNFRTVAEAFGKIESYVAHISAYHSVRNSLSHQGSYFISEEDAKACAVFMVKAGSVIDSGYFWYYSFDDVKRDIDDFESALQQPQSITGNFESIPFPINRIVCREPEIKQLFKYICSWDGVRKLRNYKHLVCISGYGGIGKTSLVTEFLSRLLDSVEDSNYGGFRPSFILFYSAKVEMMDYDRVSGEIYLKEQKSQLQDFDSFTAKLYKDLSTEKFDDDWDQHGILVIDNLETLANEEREKILHFIEYDVPMEIRTIITTRIPEHADEQIQLKGFQNEAGVEFIEEYIHENGINLSLTTDQEQELVKCSYGNSLVLVLAIKRLESRKVSYRTIIDEMQRLPKNTQDNSISHFMYQNTINELLLTYPQYDSLIKSVLLCLSLRHEALSTEILTIAHRKAKASYEEIKEVLHLLTNYLVVEKIADSYIINEFANAFVLVSLTPAPGLKAEWDTRIASAINEIERQMMTVKEYTDTYPQLSEVIDEWMGRGETESLSICHAFAMYDIKNRITTGNAAYEIDNMNREFDDIERRYIAHPYTYYQRARILKELRQDGVIGDTYNEQIKNNYESCLMLIDSPQFKQIKNTKTYPSILWIFSMFLLSSRNFSEASRYANDAVQNYKLLKIHSCDSDDAMAVWGIAECNLFNPLDGNTEHLKNARIAQEKLKKANWKAHNFMDHKKQLDEAVGKFTRIKL